MKGFFNDELLFFKKKRIQNRDSIQMSIQKDSNFGGKRNIGVLAIDRKKLSA